MSQIALLKFPLLVQGMIVRRLFFGQLFELSITNKRAKNLLATHKCRVDSIELRLFHDQSPRNELIVYQNGNQKKFNVTISNGKSNTQINGSENQLLPVLITPRNYGFEVVFQTHTTYPIIKIMKYFSKYLTGLLYFQEAKWHIAREVDLRHLWEKFGKIFSTIEILQITDISPKRIKYILEELDVEFLQLNARIVGQPGFKYQGQVSKIKRIRVESWNWIDFTNFPFQCEEVSCRVPSVKEINMVLKQWVAGKLNKLEDMMLENGEYHHRDQVLAGIDFAPTTLEIHQLSFRRFNERYDRGAVEIRRDYDNCRATVVVTPFHVVLNVWEERHLRREPFIQHCVVA